MALNFPANPTLNSTFTSGGVTYTWDGTKWTSRGADSGTQPLLPDENGNVIITGNLTVGGDIDANA